MTGRWSEVGFVTSSCVFFAFQTCLMERTLPYVTKTSAAFAKQLELQQLRMMLLGSGLTEVYLMGVAIGCLAFGKGRCLPWETSEQHSQTLLPSSYEGWDRIILKWAKYK